MKAWLATNERLNAVCERYGFRLPETNAATEDALRGLVARGEYDRFMVEWHDALNGDQP